MPLHALHPSLPRGRILAHLELDPTTAALGHVEFWLGLAGVDPPGDDGGAALRAADNIDGSEEGHVISFS